MRIVVATLAGLALLLALVLAIARARFGQQVDGEVQELIAGARAAPRTVVRADELERLPAPVARWLRVSGVVGRERAQVIRLHQRGQLRTSPDGAWLPVRAEQWFSVEPPAFVWRVDASMFHVLPIAGRDRYAAGRGHMLIKAASLANVADATGPEIDQGALLRFLGEIVWFPSAALAPYIRWEAVDDHSARATMSYAGVTASALFSFDERDRFASFTARRYLGGGRAAKLETWMAPARAWKKMDGGVEIPVEGDVAWRLAGGDFDYYRWQITDVAYDPPR